MSIQTSCGMLRRCSIFSLLISVSLSSHGQILIRSLMPGKKHFSIVGDIRENKRYLFWNLETNAPSHDGLILTGNNRNELSFRTGSVVWQKTFEKPIAVKLDSAILNIVCYTQYIDSLRACFHDVARDKWLCTALKVEYDGYQPPYYLFIKSFVPANGISTSRNGEKITIDKVYLAGKKIRRGAKIILNEYALQELKLKQAKLFHPTFDAVLGYHSLDSLKRNGLLTWKPTNRLRLPNITWFAFNGSSWGTLNLPTQFKYQHDQEKINIVAGLFKTIIECYPFREVTKMKTDSIAGLVDHLRTSTCNYTSFIDSLKTIIARYHDPHFSLINPNSRESKPKLVPGPVRLKEINGNVHVVANFNERSAPPIGSRVIKVNDKSIENLVPNIKTTGFENAKRRRQTEISKLLYSNRSDSVKLTYLAAAGADTLSVYIRYDMDYSIPRNFFPKQGNFRIINGNISYFQIKEFTSEIWFKFYSVINKIKATSGLIIDIRGNSGGDGRIINEIMSIFINRNAPLYHTSIVKAENEFFKETVVIRPNKYFHINIPTVVLIDEGTACASEILAWSLKKYANAVLIGNSNTQGSLANRFAFQLPDNAIMYFDSIFKSDIDNQIDIQGKGIPPDIWVSTYDVIDLYPYSDKVLMTAIDFLQK